MTSKKQRRFGNPARQAEVEAKKQAQVLATQAADASAAARRRAGSGCPGCCD